MECVRDKAVVWLAAAVVESLRVGSSVGGVSHVCVCVCVFVLLYKGGSGVRNMFPDPSAIKP